MTPHVKNPKLLAYSLIFGSALTYSVVILLYAQNVPAYDDYIDVIPFIISLSSGQTFTQVIALIFEQYNQHFIVTNRIIYSAIYYLTGEINFYTLVIIGNFNVLLLAFLYSIHTTGKYRLLIIATCCLLIFQISYHHTAMWPMASNANFSVISLALLSLTLLGASIRFSFILAMLFAFLATFSLGSGQLVLLVGLYVLIIGIIKKQRLAKTRLFIWLAFSGLTLALFYGLYNQTALFGVDPPLPKAPQYDIVNTALSFVALVGSPLAFGNKIAALVIGALTLTLFIVLLFRQSWRHTTIFSFSCFLFGSIGILSLIRSWVGIDVLIETERYRFVATNLLITLIILYQKTGSPLNDAACKGMAGLALVFCCSTYVIEMKSVIRYSEQSIEGVEHWVETGKHGKLRRPVWTDLEIPFRNLKTLYDRGIYSPDLDKSSR